MWSSKMSNIRYIFLMYDVRLVTSKTYTIFAIMINFYLLFSPKMCWARQSLNSLKATILTIASPWKQDFLIKNWKSEHSFKSNAKQRFKKDFNVAQKNVSYIWTHFSKSLILFFLLLDKESLTNLFSHRITEN